MKFSQHLTSHLTPEWRIQYINYDKMKDILYDALEKIPALDETDRSSREQFFAQFEEAFFMYCDQELEKVNTFFAEKIAEAQRKFMTLKNEVDGGGSLSSKTSLLQLRRDAISGENALDPRVKKLLARTHRKVKELKLAFSEFYLSLVLLQNYQRLNFTGFRKILKKHDKLFETENGFNYKKKVQKAAFFVNKGVDHLISETEEICINELEEGNRSKAMNRLRVPPLTEREKRSWVIFRCGLFFGMFFILLLVIIIGINVVSRRDQWLPILRMFRGVFLLVLIIFLVALNTCGWRAAGVNHVLIFELNPRTHLTYQQVLEASGCLAVIWSISLIGYIFHDSIGIQPFIPPLVMLCIIVMFVFNPFKFGFHGGRWWLLKIVFRIVTAPFHPVGFADFWLADQMNSLVATFLDAQYSVCYLAYGWYNTGDTCATNIYGIRPVIACLPAWFRFAQCLRRYRDTKHAFPHLVNAGKYSTTFFVVLFSTLSSIKREGDTEYKGPFFILWIISAFISTCYTLTWDIKMDWGLLERHQKENILLRDEVVYPQKAFYYLAIVENFIFRFIWTLNVSVGWSELFHREILVTALALCEIFRLMSIMTSLCHSDVIMDISLKEYRNYAVMLRRFVWNFFRLENEHLNNCGEFRAVRDISVMPLDPNDHVMLETLMDDDVGPSRSDSSNVVLKGIRRPTVLSNVSANSNSHLTTPL